VTYIEVTRGQDISHWITCVSGIFSNILISRRNRDLIGQSEDTLGDSLLALLELGHSDLLCGLYRAKFTFPMYFKGNKILLIILRLFTTRSFSKCQMIIPATTFVPYQPFDLDPFPKVTAAI